MAKKSTRRTRKSPRRKSLGAVICTRVKGKTVCKPALTGVRKSSRKGKSTKRKGGKSLRGTLKGLGSVTCTRARHGYSCKKA